MPLHPDDVVRKTFRTTSLRRGYDEAQVDAFLEEVVGELRRLRRQVDEDQAQIDRLVRDSSAGMSAQLAAEKQQLEQLRREREALAAELRDADQRVVQAHEDIARAQAQRDVELDEIRARFDQDLAVLKRRARDTREDARQLAEQARLEHEDVVSRLAALRAEAEEAVAVELGQERVTALIAGLRLDDPGPLADLGVIAGLAEALRRDYVGRGHVVAKEIRSQAEAEHDQLLAEAARRADELTQAAKRRHDDVLRGAQSDADKLLDQAQRVHEDTLRSASEQADRIVAQADEERDRIIVDLTTRRDQLQAEIDELSRVQAEHRERNGDLTHTVDAEQ